MIEKAEHSNKALIISVILGFSIPSFSQSTTSLEQRAITYFCENLFKIDSGLLNDNIEFKGGVIKKYSKVYDVAYCLKDINLIMNKIPNNNYLDSIEAFYKNAPEKNTIIIKTSCKSFTKKPLQSIKKKNKLLIFLYNAIKYKGKYYVEILLVNKKMGDYEFICIEFDENLNITSHCTLGLIYD